MEKQPQRSEKEKQRPLEAGDMRASQGFDRTQDTGKEQQIKNST
jgi:hypothetical protein